MKLRVFLLAIAITLACASRTSGLDFTSDWFSSISYVIDVVQARPGGETAASILKREKAKGAIFAVNGMYFDRRGYVVIGYLYCYPFDLTQRWCSYSRGYIYQDEKGIHISHRLPKNAFCVGQCGLILLEDGQVIPYLPEGAERGHSAKDRPRTIMAVNGHTVCFFRFSSGKLREIAKYLKSRGYTDAINLDGGSSTAKSTKVANAVVVYRKDKYMRYKAYANHLHNLRLTEKWLKQLLSPKPSLPYSLIVPKTNRRYGRAQTYDPWTGTFKFKGNQAPIFK